MVQNPAGLIHQHVTVGQVQDFLFDIAFQQAINDLESRIGFARSGGHDQKNPLLTAGDGVQRAVHGHALIISGRIGGLAGIVRLPDDGFLLGG